jgi:4-carboxymuconolactone decarboxylase
MTFDEFVQQRGSVPTLGPGSIMLNVPEVAKRGLELARYLREDASLSPRIRELAMLTTARELDCQFIWNAHAPLGPRTGLRAEIIDNLRAERAEAWHQMKAAVVHYGRGAFRPTRSARLPRAARPVRCAGVDGADQPHGLLCLLAFASTPLGRAAGRDDGETPSLPI